MNVCNPSSLFISMMNLIYECTELRLFQTSMNVNKSQGCVVEVCALTLQEAIGVNVPLAMSLLQIRRLVKVLEGKTS
jgi:hypothetical protein